jgi:hypothetical protein
MESEPRKVGVLILTHGRPDRVITYDTLRRCGYSGPIYIVIDDTDKTAPEYFKRYGAQVVVFDKKKAAEITDTMDNFNNMKAVVYARNIAWDIAAANGLTHFVVADDDYSRLGYAFIGAGAFDSSMHEIKNANRAFDNMFVFMDQGNISATAFAQGGDFIGGGDCSTWANGVRHHRKIMNLFFLRSDRRFKFHGTINEDTTAYILNAATGDLYITTACMRVLQKETQANAGGLTDIYLQLGTYVKSFYTVMAAPSCVKVKMMGQTHRRLHHSIQWDYAVPQIVHEKHRKPLADGG